MRQTSKRDPVLRILIAEDDPVSRRLLENTLAKGGYEVTVTKDGTEAFETLKRKETPRLAILDWMMPGMDGVEICSRIHETSTEPVYIILLSSRSAKEDMVEGLEAGADDYLTKPFDPEELMVRIRVGERLLQLQLALAQRVKQLEDALAHVRHLQGLLPICSYCKKIRDEKNYWHQVEEYITHHADVNFSHGFCPDCYERFVKPQLEKLKNSRKAKNRE